MTLPSKRSRHPSSRSSRRQAATRSILAACPFSSCYLRARSASRPCHGQYGRSRPVVGRGRYRCHRSAHSDQSLAVRRASCQASSAPCARVCRGTPRQWPPRAPLPLLLRCQHVPPYRRQRLVSRPRAPVASRASSRAHPRLSTPTKPSDETPTKPSDETPTKPSDETPTTPQPLPSQLQPSPPSLLLEGSVVLVAQPAAPLPRATWMTTMMSSIQAAIARRPRQRHPRRRAAFRRARRWRPARRTSPSRRTSRPRARPCAPRPLHAHRPFTAYRQPSVFHSSKSPIRRGSSSSATRAPPSARACWCPKRRTRAAKEEEVVGAHRAHRAPHPVGRRRHGVRPKRRRASTRARSGRARARGGGAA